MQSTTHSLFQRLVTEPKPGYLWTMIDIAEGLAGVSNLRFVPRSVRPGSITQATLLASMGYHKLTTDRVVLGRALSRAQKGPVL